MKNVDGIVKSSHENRNLLNNAQYRIKRVLDEYIERAIWTSVNQAQCTEACVTLMVSVSAISLYEDMNT